MNVTYLKVEDLGDVVISLPKRERHDGTVLYNVQTESSQQRTNYPRTEFLAEAEDKFMRVKSKAAWEIANLNNNRAEAILMPLPKHESDLVAFEHWFREQGIPYNLLKYEHLDWFMRFEKPDDAFHYKMRWL